MLRCEVFTKVSAADVESTLALFQAGHEERPAFLDEARGDAC